MAQSRSSRPPPSLACPGSAGGLAKGGSRAGQALNSHELASVPDRADQPALAVIIIAGKVGNTRTGAVCTAPYVCVCVHCTPYSTRTHSLALVMCLPCSATDCMLSHRPASRSVSQRSSAELLLACSLGGQCSDRRRAVSTADASVCATQPQPSQAGQPASQSAKPAGQVSVAARCLQACIIFASRPGV